MEYFDVVDESGRPTGTAKARAEVHRDGDWHRTVHVWVRNRRGELLIQKRATGKDSNPGLWDISAAGHISTGEMSLEAALKETREELGLELAEADLQFLFAVQQRAVDSSGTFVDHEFQDVYMVTVDLPLAAFIVQTEEVAELRYASPAELRRLLESHKSQFVSHDEEYRRLFQFLELVELSPEAPL